MNKSCLIVGAGPGIALACADAFARDGYDIALLSRHPSRLAEAVAELQAKTGGKIKLFTADAGDEDSLSRGLDAASEQLGNPEIAIFNAAGAQMAKPSAIPLDRLMTELRTNVGGALLMAQQVMPAMKRRRRGTILLTGGGFAYEPAADYASLSMGKAALRNLTYSLAQELGAFGIHVATVTVYGFVQSGTHFDPERIAQAYLKLHRQPKGHFDIETVYK